MEKKKNELIIIEKPQNLSWEEIHNVLWAAHARNREKGIFMKYPSLSGDEIRKRVENNGHCFVALLDGKIVGTCSFRIQKRASWYTKGQEVAYYMMEGILPEYQGKGIYGRMMEYRERYVKNMGVHLVEMDTAQNNKEIQSIVLRHGFKYVRLHSYSFGKHYSVVMAKWLEGCPWPEWYCKLRFYASSLKTKLKYKPGHIKRLPFLNYR